MKLCTIRGFSQLCPEQLLWTHRKRSWRMSGCGITLVEQITSRTSIRSISSPMLRERNRCQGMSALLTWRITGRLCDSRMVFAGQAFLPQSMFHDLLRNWCRVLVKWGFLSLRMHCMTVYASPNCDVCKSGCRNIPMIHVWTSAIGE